MLKMIIMQGLPGSGKSTLARKIQEDLHKKSENNLVEIFSTDTFYEDDEGVYRYDKTKASTNHFRNQLKVYNFFKYWRKDPWDLQVAIIDNTNITQSEAAPYIWIAKQFGAKVEVIRCEGNFKSTHDVPEETIQLMREKMKELKID